MKVLIADQESSRLLDTASILQSAGHEVLGAAMGDECLRTAKQKHPDLILLNAALPDVSGIDLAKEIKRDPELAGAYVVVLSAEETPSSIRARALESGADAYLVRTLPAREFSASLDAMLRRKRMEEKLRVSVQGWKGAFDAISDAVYLVSPDHTVLECNLAMAKLLGKPPSEIVGRRCYELVHGTPEPIPGCLLDVVQESRRRETLTVPMQDRWLQVAVDPMLDETDSVVGIVHILSDVTERKKAEEAQSLVQADLEKQLEEQRDALTEAADALQAEVTQRQQVEERLAREREKLEKQAADNLAALARSGEAFQAEVAQREQTEQELSEAQRQAQEAEQALQAESAQRQRAEQALRTASDLVFEWDIESGQVEFFSDAAATLYGDSSEFPKTVEELQRIIHPEDRQRLNDAIQHHLRTREPFLQEYRVLREGSPVSYWVASGTAEWDENGKPHKWIGTASDVTARKQAQQVQEQLAAQVNQQQRMEAVARLAGGVANDFSELLTVILGNVEVAMSQVEPSYAVYNQLAAIQKAGHQAVALTRQLVTASGGRVMQPQVLDLNEWLDGLTAGLRRVVGEKVGLELDPAPQLRPVLADAAALEEVLTNLAQNARAAMPQGGTLRIRTEQVTPDASYRQSHPDATAQEYARLTVADTGTGFEEAIREHLFEPFLTAKKASKGRELDLAVVHGIVRQQGGLIDVQSRPGEGTTFEILLPVLLSEKSLD